MRAKSALLFSASVFALSGCATMAGLPVVGGMFDKAAEMGDKAMNKPAVFTEFEKPEFCSSISKADVQAALKQGVYSDNRLANMQQAYVGGLASDADKARRQVGAYPDDKEYLDKVFIEKYGAKICSDRDNYMTENIGNPGDLETQWRKATDVMVKFQESLQEKAKAAPGAHAEALAQAVKLLDKYAAEGKTRDGGNRDHLRDNRSEVNQALDAARYQQEILAAAKGKDAPELAELTKAYADTEASLKGKVEQLVAKLDAQNKEQRAAEEMKRIAETEAPKMIYEGKDSKQLIGKVKTYWGKKYPKDKILKVWLTTDSWERKTGSRWNNNSSEWYDESWLEAAVAVKDEDNKAVANVYYFTLAKDHRDKDKLKLSDAEKGSPSRILVQNVR